MDFIRRAIAILLATLTIAWAGALQAATVHIAVPLQQGGHADLAKAIRHALQSHDPALRVTIVTVDDGRPAAEGADLLITVGDELLPWAAASKSYRAILCFYTTASRLREQSWGNRPVSALFREQPLNRQLALARELLPHLSRLALIYRDSDPPPLPPASDVAITAVAVEGESNWIRTLSELMADHEALLGIDDPELYNRNTVRSILLTAYRHGRVLIGPSRPFVTAGSLASTYTTSDQYLAQLVAMSTRYLRHGHLPAPRYPEHFQVAINYQVAASLGLRLPSESEVAAKLRKGDAP